MEMEIESQRRVEALDECHGPALRVPLGTEFPSTVDEGAEDRFYEDVQDAGDHLPYGLKLDPLEKLGESSCGFKW